LAGEVLQAVRDYEVGDPFVGRLYFWLEKKLSTGLSTGLSTSKQPDTIDTL
jgi:hypothetical protein